MSNAELDVIPSCSKGKPVRETLEQYPPYFHLVGLSWRPLRKCGGPEVLPLRGDGIGKSGQWSTIASRLVHRKRRVRDKHLDGQGTGRKDSHRGRRVARDRAGKTSVSTVSTNSTSRSDFWSAWRANATRTRLACASPASVFLMSLR